MKPARQPNIRVMTRKSEAAAILGIGGLMNPQITCENILPFFAVYETKGEQGALETQMRRTL